MFFCREKVEVCRGVGMHLMNDHAKRFASGLEIILVAMGASLLVVQWQHL